MAKQMIDIDLRLTVEKFDTYEAALAFCKMLCPINPNVHYWTHFAHVNLSERKE